MDPENIKKKTKTNKRDQEKKIDKKRNHLCHAFIQAINCLFENID